MNEMCWTFAMYWREECILDLVGSAKGKRLLGNRAKWKDNIK
jgi:hypothetical protein